ncbi:MucBP domain-containing protein, partial [Streptococcus sp. ZJ151]|uniref:MucBP domain-containing protein n=1 Tax=Streptococcus jiangjianxini TaxID=3161189 RepID=UPI0032ED233D
MFFKQKQRFSIRKYSFGAASVLLGTVLLGLAGPDASANTLTKDEQPASAVASPTPEQEPVDQSETGTTATEVVSEEPVTDNQAVEQSATETSTDTTAAEEKTTAPEAPAETAASEDTKVEQQSSAESTATVESATTTAPSAPAVVAPVAPVPAATEPAAAPTTTEAAPAEKDSQTLAAELEALKVKTEAAISGYNLLSDAVKASYVARLKETTDLAVLELLAQEAKKAQRRAETFPSQGKTATSMTGFRAITPQPLAMEAPAQEGRQVTPEVTVTSSHEGLSATPTVRNNAGTKIDFAFGNQELHKGDYFFIETQDAPVALPSTFRLKSDTTDGKGPVIATVERVDYQSDFVKGSDSEDASRFNLKNDASLTTMSVKYKVTFTEAVEGLKDVTASVSGNVSKQTLAATVDRSTEFKVKVNDKTVYTSVYTEPAWDGANAKGYQRSPYNTGYQGVITEGLVGGSDRSKSDYDTGNRTDLHAFLGLEATVYDYRTTTPGSDVPFLTETISDGLVQITGQVGGMPEGFVATISSPTAANKNTYTWDVDKLEVGQKLPVYYFPYEEVDTKKTFANADGDKLYVTPNNMYYKIEKISPDKKTITLRFYGDYSKPGRFVTSFKNPMEDFKDGKSSRLGIKFDNPDYIKEAETVTETTQDGKVTTKVATDNSVITVTKPDGTALTSYKFKATSKTDPSYGEEDVTQVGQDALTSRVTRLNYDASATGVPIETSNRDQIGKGSVIVRYVDVNGNTIKEENPVIKDALVELQDGAKTKYNTEEEAYRPAKITVGDKTYELVPEGDYTVGSVSDKHNLTTSKLRDVVASTDPTGAEPAGELTQGTKYITYVYKEVPAPAKTGSVIVKHVDTAGNPISGKDQDGQPVEETETDTDKAPVETSYETHDHKRSTITSADGTVYYYKEVQPGSDDEKGKVTEVDKTVTYVYEQAGNVVVKYVNTKGEEIQAPVNDVTNGRPGSEYNTSEQQSPAITKDNVEYVFKEVQMKDENDAPEYGVVKAGKTLVVTYVYDVKPEPEEPEELKNGSVIVKYEDTDGNIIKEQVEDTTDAPYGTHYETLDRKPEMITKDREDGGTDVYYLKELKNGSAPESGEVDKELTEVTYVYQKAGALEVKYVDENGTPIQNNHFVDGLEPDSPYNVTTTDLRPQRITTAEGKVYELVPEGNYEGAGGAVDSDGRLTTTDPVKGQIESDKTKSITFVYHEVKEDVPTPPEAPKSGDVIVHYQDETGKSIAKDKVDTDNSLVGTPYDTKDNRPETITTEDGKTYKRIPDRVEGEEEGTVKEGNTDVTYFYKEVKGKVIVHYVDNEGNEIAPDEVDTEEASTGTDYNTADDHKHETITTKDGVKYELVPTLTIGKETGKVVEGTTEVTYVYKKIEEPAPEAPKTGSVVVHYVNTDGEVIQSAYQDTTDAPVDSQYNAAEDDLEKPKEIRFGGKTYQFKEVTNSSVVNNKVIVPKSDTDFIGPEADKVLAGTTHVVYVYEEVKEETPTPPEAPKYGSVIVHYKDEEGNTIAEDKVDTQDSKEGTPYDTTDNREEKITTPDGKTYERTPKVEGEEKGTVTEGTTEVTYVYKEVKGDVVVHYIDTEGNVLQDPRTDTPLSSTGTSYNTGENETEKPTTITKDGVKYELVPHLTQGNEEGKVVEGTTKVTYVYKKVEEPTTPEAPKTGDVIVHYVDENGNKIADDKVDADDSLVDTPYDTTDNRPEKITTEDGKTYERVPDKTVGNEEGKVTEGKTEVTYVYKEVKGNVIVHYIDTEGNVIADDAEDTPETSTGTAYDTSDDHMPPTITKDGVKYELVPALTKGNEQGKVVEGTTEVTYVYKKVEEPTTPEVPEEKPGKYIPYIPQDPSNPTDPNDPLTPPTNPNGDPVDPVDYDETPEDPSDNPPLPHVPGYEPKDPKDPTGKTPLKPVDPNDPTKGYIPPTITDPNDPTKDTPVPYTPVGSVVVRYKDTDGNVIKEQETDTPTSDVDTPYSTTDHKPKEITYKGDKYVLVPSKTEGEESGKVVKGETVVTYVYQKVGNWIPEIPGVPGKDRPEVPYPFDPENPDSPVDPTKPNDPDKPGQPPVIPHVPGYIPNDPDGNPLKPVDPEDPTKGYVPPVPSNPGEDTHIPYVPAPKDPENPDTPDTPDVPDTEEPGSYIPYVPKDPKNPDPNDPDGSIEIPKVPYDETPEDPSDNPPLPHVPGYEPKDPTDPTGKTPLKPVDPNDPTKGYIPPTITDPNDPTKDTPVPYTPVGSVVVRYKDTDGNVIKEQVTDTPTSDVDTPYSTTDHKPETITYKGDKYVLVPSKTEGEESGKVVKGETVVTYVYQKVGNWIPEIPGVPNEDRPEIPYPFDPENPNDPVNPNDPSTPPIPHVPGYTPNDPDGNPLKPVDPNDPTKGYIPPVPSNPGEDTHIPYVPNTPEDPDKPDTPDVPEVPDTEEPGSYIPYVPKDPKNPDPNDPDGSIEIPRVPYDETPEDPSDNPPLPHV